MGRIIFGPDRDFVEMDDRALAHIRVAFLAKLRRHESFALNWTAPASAGSGRFTLWVHPAMYLQFAFYGTREALIDRGWVDGIIESCNSVRGLDLHREHRGSETQTPVPPLVLPTIRS